MGRWGEMGVPRENHLTPPQAELGLSFMWPVRDSNLHQSQRLDDGMIKSAENQRPYSATGPSSHLYTGPKFYPTSGMLDHPITVVLSDFDTLKNDVLKVYKFMSIQTQEDHISHIKQSKSDRF